MSFKRQSQVINNFFTLASIIIIAAVLVLYTKYIREPNNKIIPLSCESLSFTKYKVYNQDLLNSSLDLLENASYKINASYKEAKYTKSTIKNFISLKETNSYFIKAIKTKANISKKDILNINYSLVEFDKKNPKNIRNNSLRSGSIYTIFKQKDKEIFKFYTDFKFFNKKEIEERILCTIKVYKNHAK